MSGIGGASSLSVSSVIAEVDKPDINLNSDRLSLSDLPLTPDTRFIILHSLRYSILVRLPVSTLLHLFDY
jgi:hypothetical protein